MGVDTRLYVNSSWTVQDIKEVIEKRLNVPVEVKFNDFAPDYICLVFAASVFPNSPKRMLNVHTKSDVGGFPAILLSLSANEEGHRILKTIAQTLGGLFNTHDTEDTYEEYEKPGKGNIDFIVKEAIKDNPKMGDDDKMMARYLENEGWKAKDVWPHPKKDKE
jgi:hypothetical protein